MAFDLFAARGVPVERQELTWRELVQPPYSKLDDDALARVRVVWISSLQASSVRFQHECARHLVEVREALAAVRRITHKQRILVEGLHPPDLSTIERILVEEQAQEAMLACIAGREPDAQLARWWRMLLLEHVDHMFRWAAVLDRLTGQDAQALLQAHTPLAVGRTTALCHRHPIDDLVQPYVRAHAQVETKLNVLMVAALADHGRDGLAASGFELADPLARQLAAEVGSIEEQHATAARSAADPAETWMERWLLHEAAEVFACWTSVETEREPRLRRIWERLLDHELGHFQLVRALYESMERRDAEEVLPRLLPRPFPLEQYAAEVRDVRAHDRDESAEVASRSGEVARTVNADGSPSMSVAAGWRWCSTSEWVHGRRLRTARRPERVRSEQHTSWTEQRAQSTTMFRAHGETGGVHDQR